MRNRAIDSECRSVALFLYNDDPHTHFPI